MENRSNHREERPTLFAQGESKVSFKEINWGRLLSYLKPYRGRMGLALLALLISSGFGLGFPLVIVKLARLGDQGQKLCSAQQPGTITGRYLFTAGYLHVRSIVPALLHW